LPFLASSALLGTAHRFRSAQFVSVYMVRRSKNKCFLQRYYHFFAPKLCLRDQFWNIEGFSLLTRD
jgi:hypothetical protein